MRRKRCEFTLGNARACSTLRRRLQAYKSRTRRFITLRKGAGRRRASRIHRAGAVPAATYGMAVSGASDTHLQQLRRAHAAVSGITSQFASQRLGILLRSKQRDDPALPVHVLPLNAWARTVWDKTIPLDDLEQAMQWAERRRLDSRSPWQRVLGPAGAVAT
eukprot:3667190-Karenia_brevis.AAC.1